MKTYEVYHNGYSRKIYNCVDPVDAIESYCHAFNNDINPDDDVLVVDLTTHEEFLVSGWSKREFNFTVTPK